MFQPADIWFFVLSGFCILGPYVLGVPPKTRRHWFYIGLTIAFVAWVLPLMASLRSR